MSEFPGTSTRKSCRLWSNVAMCSVSDVINSAFQPPAQLDRSSGVYFVECTAQAPSNIGLTIGGQTFVLNPADLILSNGDGTCTTGIAPAETEGSVAQYVLGDVFLKS